MSNEMAELEGQPLYPPLDHQHNPERPMTIGKFQRLLLQGALSSVPGSSASIAAQLTFSSMSCRQRKI